MSITIFSVFFSYNLFFNIKKKSASYKRNLGSKRARREKTEKFRNYLGTDCISKYVPWSCRSAICRPSSCWPRPLSPSDTCRRVSDRECRNTCGRERPRWSCSIVRWSGWRLLLKSIKTTANVNKTKRYLLIDVDHRTFHRISVVPRQTFSNPRRLF